VPKLGQEEKGNEREDGGEREEGGEGGLGHIDSLQGASRAHCAQKRENVGISASEIISPIQ
jgi:hypothetical protein